MAKKNYYKVLQVDPSAEPEVIDAAYRKLALKYHPDANPGDLATRQMQDINEAYRILSDPVDRERYDRERREPLQAAPSQQQVTKSRLGRDQYLGISCITQFISITSLLIVLVGFIVGKIGFWELLVVLVLAVVITAPQIFHLDDILRGKRK